MVGVHTPYDALKQSYLKSTQYIDNQRYCICRRGDDGLVFMIECDCCKEWFHGDCIGLSKVVGSKLESYICIGCARVHYDEGEEDSDKVDRELLKKFTEEKRASYHSFKALLKEAYENLPPIQLEELTELTLAQRKIEHWLSKFDHFSVNGDFAVDAVMASGIPEEPPND